MIEFAENSFIHLVQITEKSNEHKSEVDFVHKSKETYNLENL